MGSVSHPRCVPYVLCLTHHLTLLSDSFLNGLVQYQEARDLRNRMEIVLSLLFSSKSKENAFQSPLARLTRGPLVTESINKIMFKGL